MDMPIRLVNVPPVRRVGAPRIWELGGATVLIRVAARESSDSVTAVTSAGPVGKAGDGKVAQIATALCARRRRIQISADRALLPVILYVWPLAMVPSISKATDVGRGFVHHGIPRVDGP